MIAKPIHDIDASDIDALITGQVSEARTIEYKRDLPGNSDADKKEFLADVSSFANTTGGDIVFGIDEVAGLPKSVPGVNPKDPDAEILRLNNIILSGLAPRIRHDVQRVPYGKAIVIVLRVQESWIGPHRVIFGGHDKFYARNSAGKYPLDVVELREAFLRSASAPEKIHNFRLNRILDIQAGRTPVPVNGQGQLVLHFVPLEAFTGARHVDVLAYYQSPDKLPPMGSQGGGDRMTLEGVLTFLPESTGGYVAYTHLYRTGIIEAVDGYVLSRLYEGHRSIPSVAFEERVLKYVRTCISKQQALGVSPPIYILMTMLGVKGCRLGVSNFFEDGGLPIDREVLQLPEVVVSNFADDTTSLLKPAFDLVWNACGYPASRHFDAAGRWTKPR